jgi:hypothetical protein
MSTETLSTASSLPGVLSLLAWAEFVLQNRHRLGRMSSRKSHAKLSMSLLKLKEWTIDFTAVPLPSALRSHRPSSAPPRASSPHRGASLPR